MIRYTGDDIGSEATMKEFQEHLVKMLGTFHDFCRENGLRYYMSGGTLLGAVRHRGFIPWDDDIDVNMPRPDCEKLMDISGGRIEKYFFIVPNHEDEYHAYHWKLCDESLLLKKKNGKIKPVFMDIFPIEGLPDTVEENSRHYAEMRERKKQAALLFGKKKYGGRDPIKKLKRKFEVRSAEKEGREKLFRNVIDLARKYSFDDSEYIGVMMTNIHQEEERVRKSEYLPVVEMEFEDGKFNGPKGYDTYLRQLYGDDYMELPPPAERVSRHGFVPYHRKDE